ncbi:MAG: YchJ family metal-binding protein [Methylococcales bacterium]
MNLCPCGSKQEFSACCGPIIDGAPAPSAEALMRSRYTAFVQRQLDHVERTHAPEIRDDFNRAEAERLAEECEWQGLEIRSATETGDTAEVDFVIRFRRDKKDMIQAELASFRRENGKWLYVKGEINSQIPQRHVAKVGRNDPCPCGSGKKAKKCCGTTMVLD